MKEAIRYCVNLFGYDFIRKGQETSIVREGRICSVDFEGANYRFFVDNPKDMIQKYHYDGRMYEKEELSLIRKHFPEGGVFIDVGANVGNHTIYAAKGLGASRVVAFEPMALQHTILSINVGLNEVAQKVAIHRLALSDREGSASMTTGGASTLGNARITEEPGGQQVMTARGDATLADHAPGFIKIDVEGHEMLALEGLSRTIRKHRPILFVEVDDTNADAFHVWTAQNGYAVAERYRRYPTNENYLLVPQAFRPGARRPVALTTAGE